MTTRVYRYGLLPPTTGGDLVAEQVSAAHRYFNQLVEIERRRRARVREILGGHPDVEPLGLEVGRLRGELDAAQAAIRAERQLTRSRSEDAGQRAQVRDLRAALREARQKHKAARQALRDDAAIQAAIAAANATALTESKATRAGCGCYWGTYLLIEQALDAARKSITDPAFRRWNGSGSVAVQLQGGLSWAAAASCADTRLQVEITPVACGAGKPRPRVRLRVGSDGRDPIWAEWPLILHRPLPEGAAITWAKVLRERLGGKDRWSLHLTLRLPDEWRAEPCGQGTVAIDLGWRQRDDTLRVAYLRDDSGQTREVLLDPAIGAGLRKVDDLRSIRDQHLDELRPWLAEWLRSHGPPAWLTERAQTLHQWRSPARFASLALAWRDQRWEGDAEAYDRLEVWRQRDKHLWTWEVNQRDKTLRRRREQYRVLAAELARRYRTLVVEQMDLRQLQRQAPVESEQVDIAPVRLQQRIASPSELRGCLAAAFAARGGTVVEIPAADTTRMCHACGVCEEWDAAASVRHLCACGAEWDQDDNACRNLLRLATEARERDDDADCPMGARIKDYGAVAEPRPSKWGRLGRHKGGARKEAGVGAET